MNNDNNNNNNINEIKKLVTNDKSKISHRIVVSTDCKAKLLLQMWVFLWSARKVQQKAVITHIVSGGCSHNKKGLEFVQLLRKEFQDFDYEVHFTPSYSRIDAPDIDGKRFKDFYPVYNKPYGVRHWFRHEGYKKTEEIITLVDPDFAFMSPLKFHSNSYVPNEYNFLYDGYRKHEEVYDKPTLGKPVSQFYGIGAAWTNRQKYPLEKMCGKDSNCLKVTSKQAWEYFSTGPPYIMVKEDWLKLSEWWPNMTHYVRPKKVSGGWMDDQYGWAIVASHFNMWPHRLSHYMVSAVNVRGEAWPWLDNRDENPCDPNTYKNDLKKLPVFLHYCQNYDRMGWNFHKGHVPVDIFRCDQPLLAEPPTNLWSKSLPIKEKRNAWMLCQAIFNFNNAIESYKMKFCNKEKRNLEKLVRLHRGTPCRVKDCSPYADIVYKNGTKIRWVNQYK